MWPTQERPQQMHLDVIVDDLDAAEAAAIDLGTTKHPDQPGTSFRVFRGWPSATGTVAAVLPNPHRSTQNPCSVRYGTTTPWPSSSRPIFTTDKPAFTLAASRQWLVAWCQS
jgi:hypothetical protein